MRIAVQRRGQGPDVVLFHGSMKSLGAVQGGPEAVIDAFLVAVGPAGTLAAPTTIPAFQGPRDIYDPEFNWQKDYLVGGPAAARSYHPTRDTWGPIAVPAGK